MRRKYAGTDAHMSGYSGAYNLYDEAGQHRESAVSAG